MRMLKNAENKKEGENAENKKEGVFTLFLSALIDIALMMVGVIIVPVVGGMDFEFLGLDFSLPIFQATGWGVLLGILVVVIFIYHAPKTARRIRRRIQARALRREKTPSAQQ